MWAFRGASRLRPLSGVVLVHLLWRRIINPESENCIELCASSSGIEPLEVRTVRLLAWCPVLLRCNLEIRSDIDKVSGNSSLPQTPTVTSPFFGRCFHGARTTSAMSLCCRSPSNKVGEKNALEEDESEDDGDHSVCESDLSEDEEIGKNSYDDLRLTEHEADSAGKKQLKKVVSKLSTALTAAQDSSVQHVIAKWIEEGKELGEKELFMVMLRLRKRKMYLRALRPICKDCMILSAKSDQNE